MNKYEKYIKNKTGNSSIETVFAVVIIVFMLLLIMGFYAYTYPRSVLEKEVHLLAQQAKVTGGLTVEQVEEFKSSIGEMGYYAEIRVTANGNTALGVTPRNSDNNICTGNNVKFVKRSSGSKIYIEVKIGANDGLIKGPLQWFNSKSLPENYLITETVMSERNRC